MRVPRKEFGMCPSHLCFDVDHGFLAHFDPIFSRHISGLFIFSQCITIFYEKNALYLISREMDILTIKLFILVLREVLAIKWKNWESSRKHFALVESTIICCWSKSINYTEAEQDIKIWLLMVMGYQI